MNLNSFEQAGEICLSAKAGLRPPEGQKFLTDGRAELSADEKQRAKPLLISHGFSTGGR